MLGTGFVMCESVMDISTGFLSVDQSPRDVFYPPTK